MRQRYQHVGSEYITKGAAWQGGKEREEEAELTVWISWLLSRETASEQKLEGKQLSVSRRRLKWRL